MPKTIKYDRWICDVKIVDLRSPGRYSIHLMDRNSMGECVAVCTIDDLREGIPEGLVVLKNFGDQAGMLTLLEQADVVSDTGFTVHYGDIECPVVKVNHE